MPYLFESQWPDTLQFAPDAVLLKGFALTQEAQLLADLSQVLAVSPPQHMSTSRGLKIAAAMTSCGNLGWVSDRQGYRYSRRDLQNKIWPPMPHSFFQLATQAASKAGFMQFIPDTCLINIYKVGSRMGLHQDQDERDFSQPIVSVSLGISATFLFGSAKRSDKTHKIALTHGDVVVWGGASRKFYHGIVPIQPSRHLLLGEIRYNLTFRKAG